MTKQMLELVEKHGSPLFIMDHKILKQNYRTFTTLMPHVKPFYAVKANSHPEIIKTLFDEGSCFDVASYNEFMQVHEFIEHYAEHEKESYVRDQIIFSNTIKDIDTLQKIKKYSPLMTYDNADEVLKIQKHCNTAGLLLRLRVPDTGSQVEMGSKFGAEPGEADALIDMAVSAGLKIKGVSFHVGSQCTNFNNYIAALEISSGIFNSARNKKLELRILDIGGGFPVPYEGQNPDFEKLSRIIESECNRLFPEETIIIAEPGRYMVATAATLISEIIGKSRRNGKIFYHINDGIYHTFSGVIFDHWIPNFTSFKTGNEEICAVVGPTCDSFDKISLAENLPGDLEIGDYLYTENIGAYSTASSTTFNGFSGAKIIHRH